MLGCQPAPAHRGESRDEASVEAAHQEEETTAILDGSRRLAVAESERWKRYFCSDIAYVPALFPIKNLNVVFFWFQE
jgi:hypothetical protein